jgi:hypothetical protein
MRDDFALNDKSQMLLMVSMATDKMTTLVAMYPDVRLMDTMAGKSYFCLCEFIYSLNSHKKELNSLFHVAFIQPLFVFCDES